MEKRDPEKPQNRLTPHVPAFCDLKLIVNEVAANTFSKRQKLGPSKIQDVWESLSAFIADSLKHMKGVVVPTLGTFHVGRVYELEALADDNVIRPTFRLLEGRFAGVTQARGRFRPAQRGRIVQPNFHTISRRTRLLRATCQRVIRDLLVQLGVHIVAGHQLKVEFPKTGHLVTTKKGNITFDFTNSLLQSFGTIQWDEQPGIDTGLAQKKAGMVGELAAEGTLHPMATINDLMKLCVQQDRISSGCVPRLMLERWLQREVRQLVEGLDAQTILDLLTVHTYGKSGKFVLYPSFIEALDKSSKGGISATRDSGRRQKSVLGAKPKRTPLEDSARLAAGTTLQGAADESLEGPEDQEEDEQESQDGEETIDNEATPKDEGRPSTASSYYLQCKQRLASRKEADEFNRQHFLRLSQARQSALTPKVGNDPLNVEEVKNLHAWLEGLPDPGRRPPSPELRRRMALQDVKVDEDSRVLMPLPRHMPSTKEQKDLQASLDSERSAAIKKKHQLRNQLQESWNIQDAERQRIREVFRKSEDSWPYGPIHKPEVRLPLSAPRSAAKKHYDS